MSKEIERQFFVDLAELPKELTKYPRQNIRQGYLAATENGEELRVREKGGRHFITVKSGLGMTREESEISISAQLFEQLWPLTAGSQIEKVRYQIPLEESQVAELDIYSGTLQGFASVEVEFDSEEDTLSFEPPGWFGEEKTLDERYKNRNLAMFGLPK